MPCTMTLMRFLMQPDATWKQDFAVKIMCQLKHFYNQLGVGLTYAFQTFYV